MKKIKLTDKLLLKITEFASRGLTRTDIAYILGYSKNHFLELMRNTEILSEAYNVGKVKQKSLLQERMQQIALKGSDKDAFKAGSYLLNRHHPLVLEEVQETNDDISITDNIRKEILDELKNA